MERISDLSLFLRVLDLGSISSAARYENISLAVASQRLRRLEGELGVRLFNRTTRRLHPTPEGEALAEQGRPLVDALLSLGEGLRERTTSIAGPLRVTMSASFGRLYISPLLTEFQAEYPEVSINAHLSDDTVDLIKEGFDLAIRLGNLQDSRLVARSLAANHCALVASPAYLNARGIPVHPDDLSKHDGLLMTGPEGRKDIWLLNTPEGGTVKVRMTSKFESNFGELLKDAAIAGRGISLQSIWHVANELRDGRLEVVLPSYPVVSSNIYAVTPTRHLQTPRVRAFIDFLADKFADPPPWYLPDTNRKK